MDQNELTKILSACGSGELKIRQEAEFHLQTLENKNLPIYLVQLVVELANDSKPSQSRQMAGILLKNTLSSKDESKRESLAKQWILLQQEIREKVKYQILQTLHSPTKDARKIAAQVLARIATIEFAQNSWLSVIDDLTSNITKPKSEFGVESSLMALGYICEESKPENLLKKSNEILTAIINGMKNTKSMDVKLASVNAFLNALDFFKTNFENSKERDYIMTCIFECTQSTDENVRLVSMESIVRIGLLYYEKIDPYIKTIFQITSNAIQKDKEPVQLQAIEFWSTIAEIEEDIIEEIEYCKENGTETQSKCQNFVLGALNFKFVDLLTYCLTKQTESQTEEDWNISSSASTCLSLFTKVVKESIVEFSMGFISKNIDSSDWHFKEAATLAFSAILEVPSSDNMNKLVDQAIEKIIGNISQKEILVRDTTFFTLGRISQFHPEIIKQKHLGRVLQALFNGMQDESRIASKACWSLYHLSDQFKPSPQQKTYELSQYFQALITTLLKVSERKDVAESNLRVNSYAAISSLINSATLDQYEFLEKTVVVFLKRLDDTNKQGSITKEEKEEIMLVQSLLCGTLQSLVTKLKEKIKPYGDQMMGLFLTILTKGYTGGDEVFLVISTLITIFGKDFERYLKPFIPLLEHGLQDIKAEQVCLTCISIVTDLTRELGRAILPYCDSVVAKLLQNLQSQNIPKSLKPPIISCFGDIAQAVESDFEKYMIYVGMVLQQAAEAKVDPKNEEMVEYLNSLRDSVITSYSGILQGLKKEKAEMFLPHVEHLLKLIMRIASEQTIDPDVFKNTVGIIGDLMSVYGQKMKPYINNEQIGQLIRDALSSKDEGTREAGDWAYKQLQKN